MSDNPNKLNRFWQELKRRKVIHVITVYASASFVLIELINNVTEPLSLPQSLSTIAIVVLAVGFPFAVVLSWIFDVTPKGVEKTKPSSEVSEEEKVATPNSWRNATYISVVIIIGLISYNLLTRSSLSENLALHGKSIAVLPFTNVSQNEEDEIFINGTMESIHNKLCMIKDLRVMRRESVEPYRAAVVSVSEVIEKLGTSFVLQGSMRRYGETVVLNVQLIDQHDNTIWSRQIDKDIHEIEELLNLESQIAHEVAKAIKAVITPEELQRIQKVPTSDPIARQLCQEAYMDFIDWIQNYNDESMESSNRLYRQALTFDSTYVDAIAGLGMIHLMKDFWGDRSQQDFLDSAKKYIDRSLAYDSEHANTYLLQGFYYFYLRDWTAAERSYNKCLEYNPNDPVAYTFLGNIYKDKHGDDVKAIQYFEEAEKRNQGELINPVFYRMLGGVCMRTGCFEMAEENLRKALVFDGDSVMFTNVMANLEYEKGNIKKAAELENRSSSKTEFPGVTFIDLWMLIYTDQIEEANLCVRQYEKYKDNLPWFMKPWNLEHRGYLSLISGDVEKAELLFDELLDEFNTDLQNAPNWLVEGRGHIDAAMICAYRGQKEQAYRYLNELLEMRKSLPPSEIRHLELNPMFDTLREEERFQKILSKMWSDYQDAHKQMRLYLEETGRL